MLTSHFVKGILLATKQERRTETATSVYNSLPLSALHLLNIAVPLNEPRQFVDNYRQHYLHNTIIPNCVKNLQIYRNMRSTALIKIAFFTPKTRPNSFTFHFIPRFLTTDAVTKIKPYIQLSAEESVLVS